MSPEYANTTGTSLSEDSGSHWTAEGAWTVGDGVYRVPLPLPTDDLKAINVYVIEQPDGLVLIDGGWAIEQARNTLRRVLHGLGADIRDIRRILVTHVHRDHYTMASAIRRQLGTDVALGRGEMPILDLLNNTPANDDVSPTEHITAYDSKLLRRAGAYAVADQWRRVGPDGIDTTAWGYPSTWLEEDQRLQLPNRTLQAVHTPGHTPGHFVFADTDAGLLFAGDHVLPTITPSIGFTVPRADQPLRDFMGSLEKILALPDLLLLPAHGPIAPSSHNRAAALLQHHEERLNQCIAAIPHGAAMTALQVAQNLGWTRHSRSFEELDLFNQGLAAMETMAHLDLLTAAGTLRAEWKSEALVYARPIQTDSTARRAGPHSPARTGHGSSNASLRSQID